MLRQSRFLLGVVSLFLVLFQGGASATPLKRSEVPAPLQAWTDWAMDGYTKKLCPFLDGAAENFRCAWPGRLELQLGETQGQFSQQWLVHDPGWVYLPGNTKLWPQNVRVDGTASATLARAGTPSVWLEKGTHRVSGEFLWDAPPELLKIPHETGIIQLTLRGEKVDFPRRNEKGELWLQQRNLDDSGEKSRLEVVVHRLLTDAIPVQLTTRIELRVSGKSREVLLGRVLPEGWTPLSFRTPVPARLEPDGHLRVQVRPGTWVLHLESHYDAPLAEVKRPQPDGLWDKHEVWTFAARPALRVVEVGGAARVDPQQTLLPEEWRSYPAFLMESDSRLILEEKHRGDADPVADRLSLTRQWWLDFDGEGYTVHDEMSGVINRSNRIEMQPETTLGRLALNGKDQFITNLKTEANQVGIEVPLGSIQLEADSRIEAVSNSSISAVSWDQDFYQVSGLLHLPPGWDVLHIGGVDEASETWVKNWDLLNLFMVLVLSMAFFRLWGPAWGVAALLTLVLTYTEYGAPNWAWVHLLIAEALFRAVPEGKFDRWVKGYRFAAIAGLVLISLSFMVTELRTASFPSLEYPWTKVQRFEALDAQQEIPSEKGLRQLGAVHKTAMDSIPSKKRISSAYRDDVFDSFSNSSDFAPDQNARITTGPGLPTWTWNSVNLIWHGPVARDQALHLYLLSPACNLFLAILRVGLLALLLACVLNVRLKNLKKLSTGAALCSVLALLLGTVAPNTARAEDASMEKLANFPSEPLLKKLRERLLEKPVCAPHCASILRAHFEFSSSSFQVRLRVDAAAETAIPLPAGSRDFNAEWVQLDGVETAGVILHGNKLWLMVGPGTHEVLIRGNLPPKETIEIPLPLKPRRITANAMGWTVHGLLEDGLAADNLQLSRIREVEEAQEETLEPGSLPPFVRVERSINLGLSWRVTTEVARVNSSDTTVVLEVPLLPGESVTSEQVRVKNGFAQINLGPGVRSVRWKSVLSESDGLVLQATESVPWIEVWNLSASPIWHVEAAGIPVVHTPIESGHRARRWQPWPGEQVSLKITRPKGVEGRTVTIDHSVLSVAPGRRATDMTLKLRIRSSQGGEHPITLPAGAELQKTLINGVEKPLRKEGDAVTLPLTPGSQDIHIEWREPRGISTYFKNSAVDLGVESVNASLEMGSMSGRWILFAGGPRLGPAVLFWPVLIIFGLVAVGLGRIPLTPLKTSHWLLLALGLTQASALPAAVVAGWFVFLGWRKSSSAEQSKAAFNGLQILTVLWTIAALSILAISIQKGLLGTPEMQIAGNGSSYSQLQWYQDRNASSLPQAWVLSVPLLAYRFAMLAWALWLAQAMIQWLRWGWECFGTHGYWKEISIGKRKKTKEAATTTEA